MEVAGFSKILVNIYHITWGQIPQNSSLEGQYILNVRQLYRHSVVLVFLAEGAVEDARFKVWMELLNQMCISV